MTHEDDDSAPGPDGPADPAPDPADWPPEHGGSHREADTADVDDVPTVSCTRCDREWTLAYELDELQVGNQAVEQFALDHERHTGHFPDGLSTWQATCRQCPEAVDRLDERPARRWARTHARHTGHAVAVDHASLDGRELVEEKSE